MNLTPFSFILGELQHPSAYGHASPATLLPAAWATISAQQVVQAEPASWHHSTIRLGIHRRPQTPSPLNMHCALCLSDKPLQESHIIPEFLYGVMYDEKHRYNVLSLAPVRCDRLEQKGARERLLCRECEQHFSKLERYASLVLKGGAPGMDGERNDNIISVTGIDYAQFKLFLLSLLWRAGVAKGRYFERVTLGPHEERLRLLLRDGDPGAFDLYPCILWGLNLQPGEIPQLMVQPCRDRVWGHTTYHFVVPGFKLVYFVSNQRLSPQQSQFVLQHDGSLVFQVRSVLELPSVSDFMQKYESEGRGVQDWG